MSSKIIQLRRKSDKSLVLCKCGKVLFYRGCSCGNIIVRADDFYAYTRNVIICADKHCNAVYKFNGVTCLEDGFDLEEVGRSCEWYESLWRWVVREEDVGYILWGGEVNDALS